MGISDKLCLPKDVIHKASVIHAIGQFEVYLENYKYIIEYTQELVYIQARTCKIKIIGKNLQIVYFNNCDMKICGRIKQIEYC